MPIRHLRRLATLLLFVLTLVALIYTGLSTDGDNRLLLAALVLGVIGAVEGITIIVDRLFPAKELQTHQTAQSGSVDDYLAGRIREIEKEDRLFVDIKGSAQIVTEFSVKTATYDDIVLAAEQCGGRFVLVGDPGAGKSTVLRHLLRKHIRDYQRDEANNRLPLWINLGLSNTPVDVDEQLQYWWDKQHYLPGSSDQYLKQNNLALFMDGLNEMPLDSCNERAKALKNWLEAHPDLPVAITCRTYDYTNDKRLDLGLSVITLSPLDDPRIESFIKKRDGDVTLWDTIKDSQALYTMAQNPYQLTLMLAVHEVDKSKFLPQNLNALYSRFLAKTFEHYVTKRVAQKETKRLHYNWPTLEAKLKQLGFKMMSDEQGTVTHIRWAQKQIGRRALIDGINLGVLVREGDSIRFYHHTLHSYFADDGLTHALKLTSNVINLPKRQTPAELINQIGNLGEAGVPAVDVVVKALHDPIGGVAEANRQRLNYLFDKHVFEPLMIELKAGNTEAMNFRRVSTVIGLAKKVNSVFKEFAVELSNNEHPSDWDNVKIRIQHLGIISIYLKEIGLRWFAVQTLGKIGGEGTVDSLITALGDSASFIRWSAARTLGTLNDARAVEPLITKLSDPIDYVRWGAAVSLGALGDTRAVKPLITLLTDSETLVQTAAKQALIKIGKPSIEPLQAAKNHPSDDVRRIVAEILETLQTENPRSNALHHSNQS